MYVDGMDTLYGGMAEYFTINYLIATVSTVVSAGLYSPTFHIILAIMIYTNQPEMCLDNKTTSQTSLIYNQRRRYATYSLNHVHNISKNTQCQVKTGVYDKNKTNPLLLTIDIHGDTVNDHSRRIQILELARISRLGHSFRQ